ncbi:unnamed protein product, partial [Citrullus colocynthis]
MPKRHRETRGNNQQPLAAISDTSNQQPFTKDLLDMLHQLLNKTNQPSVILTGNGHQGNQKPLALHTQTHPSEWIVDSGASDHMT